MQVRRDTEIINYDTGFKNEKRGLALHFGLAVILWCGVMTAYLSCVPLDGTAAAICFAAGIAAIGASALLCLIKKVAPYAPLAACAAALPVVFITGISSMANGFVGFINYIISWYNIKYDDIQQLLPAGAVTQSGISTFSLVLMLLFAALCFWTARERGLLRVGIIAAVFTLGGLLIGRFSPVSAVCFCAGAVGMLLLGSATGGYVRRAVWFFAVCALLAVPVFIFGTGNVPAVDAARGRAAEAVDTLRYGEKRLPGGDLAIAYKMNETDNPTLTVHSEQIKNLYLKGYSAGRYYDGKWFPPPRTAFGGKNSGMLEWFGTKSFSPVLQYSSYIAAGGAGDAEENLIQVTNTGARRDSLYIPYSADMPENAASKTYLDTGVVSSSFFGTSEYELTETSDNTPCELILAGEWLLAPENDAENTYSEAEAVYRQFAYENYLDVDADLLPLIQSLFVEGNDAKVSDGVYVVTDRIRTVLQNNARYSSEPGEIPSGAEPIEWFLTTGHIGNSALFASAAVEAYRAFGIPARYAEGYYVSESALSDGNGTAELTDKDAHAWAEVYMDGVGWVPVDVTPGFYYDSFALRRMVEQPRGIMRSAEEDMSENKANESDGDDYGRTEQDKDGFLKLAFKILLGMFTLILILVCAALFAAEIIGFLRYGLLLSRYRRADNAGKSALLCLLLQRILSVYGITAHPGWRNEETEQRLRKKFPDVRGGEYVRAAELTEKRLYAETELMPHELRVLKSLARKLYNEKTDLKTKLKLRYHVFKAK